MDVEPKLGRFIERAEICVRKLMAFCSSSKLWSSKKLGSVEVLFVHRSATCFNAEFRYLYRIP